VIFVYFVRNKPTAPQSSVSKTLLMVKIFICSVFCLCVLPGQAQNDIQKGSDSKNHSRFHVLVFLATDCPISQDYIGVLNKIQSQYQAGSIQGILAEKISKKQLKRFQDAYQVKFLLSVDKDFSLVKQFNIHVTPEVVLLDSAENIQYRGAIDNWYYELGRHRQITTENYLVNAIEAVLKKKDVVVISTEPIGCILPKRN